MGTWLVVGLCACAPSGQVIVVLDSTTAAGSLEVVAVAGVAASVALRDTASERPPSADVARFRMLNDSATTLAARFGAMRDSLNNEVAALETMDRRTRSYAVRYAEIRRRTLAAEQVRARRDSLHALVAELPPNVRAAGAAGTHSTPSAVGTSAPAGDQPAMQRHPVNDSIVTLTLSPGAWSIGVAARGKLPLSSARVMVQRGSSDTLRLSARPAPSTDTP